MTSRRADALCVGLVALVSVVVRVLWLEQAEIGGDAVEKWHFVKQWFHAFSFAQVEWDHHRARFGVNLVAFVVQALTGDGPLSYWVAPVLASTAAACAVFAIARALLDDEGAGRVVGVIAACAIIMFPPTIRAGSQLLPEVFTAAYATGAAWLVLVYARSPRWSSPALWGAAVLAFLGYSAKETGVFFAPGLFLMIALVGRVRDGFVFGGAMAALFALECAFFIAVSPYTSRFGVVKASHGAHPRRETVDSVLGLVTRYHKLEAVWIVALLAFVVAFFVAFAWVVRRRAHARKLLAVALVPASFLFFFTFMVRGLNPITLWARTLDRYLDAVAPLVLLVIVVAAASALLGLVPFDSRVHPRAPFVACAALACACLAIALVRAPWRAHPIVQATRASAAVSDTYARGLPFQFVKDERGKIRRGAFSLYVDSSLLVRDGALIDFEELGLDARVAPDASPKDPCVLRLRSKKSKIYLKPTRPLPATCAAPPGVTR